MSAADKGLPQNKRAIWCSGCDGVVPFRVEVIAGAIEGRHLGIADLDALGIGCRVEFAGDGEAGVSRSRSDQFDDRQVAGQGSCPPVLRNVGKEAVLDAVPLGCPWRVMAHAKRQAGFIGEFLQFQLPQPDPRPVGTPAVGGDHESTGRRIALAPHLLQPGADGVDSELSGVMGDADAATVVGEIVNSVRNGLAQFLVLKVVAVDPARLAFAAPVRAGVPVVADQLLLLRIDRDHRLIVGQDLGIDVLELGITVRMVAAFVGLEVTLATEAKTAQQAANRVGGDLMPHRAQRRRQLFRTLRDPQQRSLRIPQRRRLDQAQKVAHQRGIGVGQPLATAARPPKPPVRRYPLIEFLQSPSNRTGCDAGRPRYGGDCATAQDLDVARGKQAARTLIQSRPQHLVLAPYGFLINHATETTAAASSQKPLICSCPYSMRLFCGVSLTTANGALRYPPIKTPCGRTRNSSNYSFLVNIKPRPV